MFERIVVYCGPAKALRDRSRDLKGCTDILVGPASAEAHVSFSLGSPRIKKSGGFVTWNSLGQPNVNGRLAMTRSIGDFDLKNMGVIAQPETRRIKVRGSEWSRIQ